MSNLVDVAPTSPNSNPPTVWIDFSKANLDEIRGLEPGSYVKVMLVGKVVSTSMRQEDSGKMGSLSLEYKSVEVEDAPKNDFEMLSEEDD